MEDYRVECRIGDGSQGVVYRVKHVNTGLTYAMKVICCVDQEQVNAALKEAKVLLQLRHPNIVSYVDFFLVFNNAKMLSEFERGREASAPPHNSTAVDRFFSLTDSTNINRDTEAASGSRWKSPSQDHVDEVCSHRLRDDEITVCLVMELCSCGDMQSTIKDSKVAVLENANHPITEAQVLVWIEQCAAALKFIHSKGFLHRDLKPTNVFFDAERNVKIGDFGLAAAVGCGRQSAVGTPYYLAPERMLQERYDSSVDVWGLGVMILELLTLRERPINSMVLENPSIVKDLVEPVTRMGFSTKLAGLVQDMLQRQPTARPTAAAIRRRVASIVATSQDCGISANLLANLSGPNLTNALCAVCEVEPAVNLCNSCQSTFCDGCDKVRHRHHSRNYHKRISLPSTTNSINQTISASSPVHYRLNSEPLNDLSMNHTMLSKRDGVASAACTTVRVPAEYPTLSAAVEAVRHLPNVRRILVAGSTLHTHPLVLTASLPENIHIIGESPPPVVEVSDHPYALCCASGRGLVENFVIRHNGESPQALQQQLHTDTNCGGNMEGVPSAEKGKERKHPRITAVAIAGGEWRLQKCHISCVGGSGVTVGDRSRHLPTATGDGDDGFKRTSSPQKVVDPIIMRCFFEDVNGAGVVVMEKCRGTYEHNFFTGCGYAAFLLKKESSPRIRSNRIMNGGDTGIFCQDAQGSIEYNLVAQNAGCGVVIRGPRATTIFRKNRILSNAQAGFFCCDRSSPFLSDNEIRYNEKVGVLIKTKSTPKVTKNVIADSKEVGIYVFEAGGGIIEENRIISNKNAGILVTSEGNPHVINNILAGNAYEGVWVCRYGKGTFCNNDMRGNQRGAKDVSQDCQVVWVGNKEE